MEKSNKSEFKQIDDKIHLSLEYVCYFKSKCKYEETNCISIRSKFENFEETLGKILLSFTLSSYLITTEKSK